MRIYVYTKILLYTFRAFYIFTANIFIKFVVLLVLISPLITSSVLPIKNVMDFYNSNRSTFVNKCSSDFCTKIFLLYQFVKTIQFDFR